jgi:stress response protein YsnF
MKSMEEPQILSLLKDKLRNIGRKSNSDISAMQSESKRSDAEDRREVVALMSSSVDDNKSETEKAIPLWAEELEINKKMVKVAEIVIRKGRVIEKKKMMLISKKK